MEVFLYVIYKFSFIHDGDKKKKKNREKSDPLNISLSAFSFFPQSEKKKTSGGVYVPYIYMHAR